MFNINNRGLGLGLKGKIAAVLAGTILATTGATLSASAAISNTINQ